MRTTRILTTCTAILALGAASAVPASAGSDAVRVGGKCTKTSTSKLKLSREDGGRIEVDFEVDNNINGRVWNVAVTDNAVSVFKGAATTRAPSGSFEVRRLIADRAGTDRIVATAKSRITGETCTAAASL